MYGNEKERNAKREMENVTRRPALWARLDAQGGHWFAFARHRPPLLAFWLGGGREVQGSRSGHRSASFRLRIGRYGGQARRRLQLQKAFVRLCPLVPAYARGWGEDKYQAPS